MTLRVWIPKRFPSLNEYVDAERKNRYMGNAMKQQYQNLAMMYIHSATRGKRFERPVYMRYTWYEPNKKRDKDNVSSFGRKVIQDAFVSAKTIPNDGWMNIIGFSDEFVVDKNRTGVEILITDDVIKV